MMHERPRDRARLHKHTVDTWPNGKATDPIIWVRMAKGEGKKECEKKKQ